MKIIFLGSQGSGKSTQAKFAAHKLGRPFIEMGQLFRDRAKGSDPQAQEIRKALEAGNLVPDEIAVNTLKKRISMPDCANGYILDGYPRNFAQLEGLDQDINKVYYIKVSDREGLKRSIGRARKDDNLTVLTQRLQLYHKKTEPLLTYFTKRGILEEVDGERTIEEIRADVEKRLDQEFAGK